MAEYLTRTVYGPDGGPGLRGAQPPEGWDAEFLDGLRERGALVDESEHPYLALPVGTPDEVGAAWERVEAHDPDDVLAATAADRVRLAARDVGRHDIARSRGRDVALSGRATRPAASRGHIPGAAVPR